MIRKTNQAAKLAAALGAEQERHRTAVTGIVDAAVIREQEATAAISDLTAEVDQLRKIQVAV